MHFQSFLLENNLDISAIRELLFPPFVTWHCFFLSLWALSTETIAAKAMPLPTTHLVPVFKVTAALSGLKTLLSCLQPLSKN